MKSILPTLRLKSVFLWLFLILLSGEAFAALKISRISVEPQSTAVTYGDVSSVTYKLTLTETGNGNGSSTLSINWSAPAGVTVSGLGPISLTGNGQIVTMTITSNGTTPAGSVAFTISSTVNVVTSNSANFVVGKKVLTITALNASKDFGSTYSLGTTAFSAVGLVGNQTIGNVTLTSAGAASSAAVGEYPIVPSAATGGTFNAANYTISYVNGILTVNQGSVGGTLNGATTICLGTTSTLNLSDYIGVIVRWESSINPFDNWISIAHTNSSYTPAALSQTTKFRAVVQNGSSPIAYSNTVEITTGGTTTWNGSSWSNGDPDAVKSAVIAGAFTSNGISITACSLTVNNNAVVLISAGDSVELKGPINVAAGSTVTFESNANLIQSGPTNTNSGQVTIKRESAPIKRLDYTLWSSPVSGQQLQAFSPQTMTNRFYTYNTATNLYDVIAAPSATNFETAKGYLIRASNYQSATQAQPWLGTFTGVPNNGNYNYTLANVGAGNRFNLIGNPYPSSLDVDMFINSNAGAITGTLYFWRKTNGSTNASYCTFTPLGGFVSNGHAAANAFAQNAGTNIQPGQGFFVEAKANGSGVVHFNNAMRINNHSNQFLKTNNTASSIERNRIWLNATNSTGAFSQTMIGYITNATQDVDDNIDGKYINDGDIALASLIGSQPYAIQGRALPFASTDVVPLSFKAATAGNYTIAVDHVDGLFSNNNQSIYLRDNLTATLHDLTTGAYAFSAEAGTFNNRFELVYQQQQLSVSAPTFNATQVVIYRDPANNLVINSGNEEMKTVSVYDITGKLLTEQKNINSNQTAISLNISNEIVLVQITGASGVVVTKKYLYQRLTIKKDKNTQEKTQIANDE